MARKKSSGPGGVVVIAFLAVVGLAMSIPKEVWVAIGVGLVIWLVMSLQTKSKTPPAEPEVPPLRPRTQDPIKHVYTPKQSASASSS